MHIENTYFYYYLVNKLNYLILKEVVFYYNLYIMKQ